MPPVKAYAAARAKAPLAPFEIQRREPGPNDVVIDIQYCGVCHSDVHQARDEWGNSSFPMVPGHEIIGAVVRIGAKVTRHQVGDRVGVGCFVDSCRTCDACRDREEQFCLGIVLTYNSVERDRRTPTFGGYSTQVVVDEQYVLKIPASLAPEAAAPLLCAGITTYSPLKHWGVGTGSRIAVVGLGGLGHMAVKIASTLGAPWSRRSVSCVTRPEISSLPAAAARATDGTWAA